MMHHNQPIDEVCKTFSTDPVKGLSSSDAKKRLQEHGKNQLPPPKKISTLTIFLDQFKNFIVWVLIVACIIAFFLGEWIDGIVIAAITIINALLGFVQEWKSIRSIEELIVIEKHETKVIRDGHIEMIPSEEIVPGDLIVLEAGTSIPADGRIIHQNRFSTNEAALTGESASINKSVEPVGGENIPIGDRKNMVFRGTDVGAGKAKVIITETGLDTEIGKIASMMESIEKRETPLQKRLSSLGLKLVYLCVGIILTIFLIGLWKGFPIYSLVMTSLSLAVAAIPEGLPAVVTIALAIGVQRMVKKKALIRKLTAVETLGCTTVICTDKTGTLTENSMQVEKVWVNHQTMQLKDLQPKNHFALEIATLCNSATESTGDPTEIALVKAAKEKGISQDKLLENHEILDEIPFDSERKRMSMLIKNPGGIFLYVKGAPDVIASLCNSILLNENKVDFSEELRKEVDSQLQEFASHGLRVLACAYKPIVEGKMPEEEDLIFVGLIGMHDPPREGVKEALQECKKAKMNVLMLTGDHIQTAVAIAKDLEISGEALEGTQLDQMSDDDLSKKLDEIKILARVSPKHKMRIIDLFQKKGEIVAMTGDGVNDAPAIEKADIGVAMGITGTDVTKSTSDLVILDDNFNTIVQAVKEGRSIYDNIIKFTSYLFSCNLAEVIIVFSSIFFLEKSLLILAPIQLLWINIVTDGLPAIALALDPISPRTMSRPPRAPKSPLFSRNWLIRLIGLALLISILTMAIFLIHLPGDIIHARTLSFTALVIFELSKPFLLRLPYKIGFSNAWLLGAVFSSFLLQLGVIYLPFLHVPFETTIMNLSDWGWILGGLCILWIVGFPLMRYAKPFEEA